MTFFSEQDKRLIVRIQESIPLVSEPFAVIAEQVGITGDAVIEKIKQWKAEGIIRRFGAVVHHRKFGKTANAMSIWSAPKEKKEELGKALAARKEVSHCYERAVPEHWRYSIFAMLHAESEEECQRVAKEVAKTTGIHEYELLFTIKEFKKTSLRIF